MSASIHWSPIRPGKALNVNAPSAFMEVFANAEIPLPCDIGPEHRDLIKGMRASSKWEREAWDELLEAIDKHGTIHLEASW